MGPKAMDGFLCSKFTPGPQYKRYLSALYLYDVFIVEKYQYLCHQMPPNNIYR